MSWLVIQVGSGCGDVVARLDAGSGRSCLSFWGHCSLTLDCLRTCVLLDISSRRDTRQRKGVGECADAADMASGFAEEVVIALIGFIWVDRRIFGLSVGL